MIFCSKLVNLKSNSSMLKLSWTVINYVFYKFVEFSKDFFSIQRTAGSRNVLHYERPLQQVGYIIKDKRKRKPYKTFKILNVES